MGRRPRPALGARGKRGDAAPGEPDGGGALSREARLYVPALSARRPRLRDGPYVPGVRRDARPLPTARDRRRRGVGRGARVCVRRADRLPVLQRHLPRRRGLGTVGRRGDRRMVARRPSPRDRGARGRPGDAGPRRRPAGGVRRGGRSDRVCPDALDPRPVGRPAELATSGGDRRGRGRRRAGLDRPDDHARGRPPADPAEEAAAAAARDVRVEQVSAGRLPGGLGRRRPVRGAIMDEGTPRRWPVREAGGRALGGGGAGGGGRRGATPAGDRVYPIDRTRGRRGDARRLPVQHGAVSGRRTRLARRLRLDRRRESLVASLDPAGRASSGLGPLLIYGRGDAHPRDGRGSSRDGGRGGGGGSSGWRG